MGPQLEYLETVLTCKGNFYAPDFSSHLDNLKCCLQKLVSSDNENKLVVKKVEPWNSVRVTLKMPVSAAQKLKMLAEQRDRMLHEIGILEVQIEGDKVISLTIDGSRSDVADQTPIDGLKKSDTKGLLAPFSSGQSVPSNETLKSFNNLPQSFNLDWSVSSKTLSSTDPAALLKPGIGSDGCFYSNSAASSNIYNLISKTCNSTNITFGACQAVTPQTEQASCNQQTGKMWTAAEEKLVSSQNIASSSPLLVNLLKSPGNRAQLNNLTAAQSHTPCELPTNPAVPALKRKRNQSRKCKRLKEEARKSSADCSFSNQSSDQSIPGTSSSFQYDSLGNCSLDGLTNPSESRQIINPYTGVLEPIDDNDDRTYVVSSSGLICSKNMSAAVSCASECSIGTQVSSCSRFNTNLNKTSAPYTSFSDSNFLQPSSQPCLITSTNVRDAKTNFGASSFVTNSSIALHNSIRSSIPELIADKNTLHPNNLHISQHNHNIAMSSHQSVLSNPPKSHFLSNKPTCYMQDMIQLLSAENKASLLSSQPLLIATCPSRSYDAFKPMIDPSSLAKIMAQSSVLSNQNTLRNMNPSLFDTRAVSLQHQVMFGLNGQMAPSNVSSRLPFIGPAAVNANNMDTKSSQPNFLSLEEFNKSMSTTVNDAMFNGHPDASCFHLNTKHSKTDCSSDTKSGLPYTPEYHTANGCHGSKLPIDCTHTESIGSKSVSSISSSTSSVSPDARLVSSVSEARSTQSSVSKVPLKKPLKNQEEILPQKSKANLTVAQLLEQVEIAKSHLASTNSNLQKDVPCDSTLSHLTAPGRTYHTTDTKSASIFPSKSMSTHKISLGLGVTSYSILESLPMPITSPGYPHNLTESVQKAMQGVDFSSSPPPSPHPGLLSQMIPKQSGTASQNHSTNYLKFQSAEKDLARTTHASAKNLKDQASNYIHLDVFENQFELSQLEEALKSSCRGQGLLPSGHEHISSDGLKSLSDIDGSELDFVFNDEDERHLDSIIALKDYDDIEKLAETLASNIDDENIDEEMLISEHDVGLMYAENSVFMSFRNDLLINSSLLDSSKASKSGEQEVGPSQANPQSTNENTFNSESKSDENAGASVPKSESPKLEITKSDEIRPVTQSADIGQATTPVEGCSTEIKCEDLTSTAAPPDSCLNAEKAEDACEAATLCTNSNRMATRSSNKQKPHGSHSLSCSTSNHHMESLQSNTLVFTSSVDNSKGSVECATPTPRRSNRTIRKTELASESLQAKATEKSKRVLPREEENTKETVKNNRARSTPKTQSAIPSRSVQNLKPVRHRTPQKRKYSKGTVSENSIIENDEGVKQQQPPFDKEIETLDISSSPGCLDSSLSETDRTPCAKKQKTS